LAEAAAETYDKNRKKNNEWKKARYADAKNDPDELVQTRKNFYVQKKKKKGVFSNQCIIFSVTSLI
jgi:hypothetical protein